MPALAGRLPLLQLVPTIYWETLRRVKAVRFFIKFQKVPVCLGEVEVFLETAVNM